MNINRVYKWLMLFSLLATTAYAQEDHHSYLTDQDLLAIAGDKYASGELPLGDYRYVLDAPRTGYIYLCHKFGEEGRGGAGRDGRWIHGQTWNLREKTSVQGRISWSDAQFSVTRSGNARVLAGNGLPINHATGIFPVQPDDPAYAVDRNPNSIAPQSVNETLPAEPAYSSTPFCMGMEVGYMLDGVPLFNGFDAGLRDAAAHEVQDSCEGHPERTGQYHYHSLSSCIPDAGEKTVIGYALDGFPITGPVVAAGKYLTTADLDECHGLTSEIVEDGQKKIAYHYVMTVDFPYSASCFRAKPVRTGPPQNRGASQSFQPVGQMPYQSPPQMPSQMQHPSGFGPPAEALAACSGRHEGDECGFISPRGDNITGVCRTPPSMPLACIPSGGPR